MVYAGIIVRQQAGDLGNEESSNRKRRRLVNVCQLVRGDDLKMDNIELDSDSMATWMRKRDVVTRHGHIQAAFSWDYTIVPTVNQLLTTRTKLLDWCRHCSRVFSRCWRLLGRRVPNMTKFLKRLPETLGVTHPSNFLICWHGSYAEWRDNIGRYFMGKSSPTLWILNVEYPHHFA